MAALTLANAILFCRQQCQDTSTTLQGASDAQYTLALNERTLSFFKVYEQKALEAVLHVCALNEITAIQSSGLIASEILSVTRSVGTGATVGMERMEYPELRNLQSIDSTAGTPVRYATYKRAASDQKWQVAFHPIPDAAYTFNAIYVPVAGAYPDVMEDAESYWVARLAASDIAAIIGRDDLIEAILKPVPEDVQGKMKAERTRLDPKRRPEEVTL